MIKKHLKLFKDLLIGLVVGLLIGFFFGRTTMLGVPRTTAKQGISPSIFMTGSDGKINTIDPMVQGLVTFKDAKAQRGLQFMVQSNGSLKVSGTISRRNKYPTIEIGMVDGTNNGSKVEKAIVTVLNYLEKHYTVNYYNMLGFSAGGTGVYQYLIDHSTDRSLPVVKKWVSLDGQYNASTAQPDQTLQDVLTNGPKIKSKYYPNWEKTYQKLSSTVQVAMLEGNYDEAKQTDGVVPWADTFSIYHFLVANNNPVSRKICTGDNTWHGDMPKNKEAIAFVADFFYE